MGKVEVFALQLFNSISIAIQEFIYESDHNVTYNAENTHQRLLQLMYDDSSEIFVDLADGNDVTGFAIVSYDEEFHTERFGYVNKFYVRKKYRGTKTGRKLTEEITKWFDANGCIESFATSTALIGEDKLFENLLSKYGYNRAGTVMKRGLNVKIQ